MLLGLQAQVLDDERLYTEGSVGWHRTKRYGPTWII